ncbi:alpha/beta hydrolase [Geodermatophilus sp. YIM 151500]|uniref:alpha/beta hydrolase n=1 Tax=Geodermatophilus sp. YIM 151500 TaxID=2984531 RepID=UPI0021E4A687|nr:alpha/beta hydrolase [Geodermatophilus sp. YIM 151500]MCV2488346.1 alpha/beta hydrolase [Geodermatophilus sp. YIM 151500]
MKQQIGGGHRGSFVLTIDNVIDPDNYCGMATLSLTRSSLSVRLSRGEKVAGLLRDLEVPLTSVRSAEVVDDPLAAVRGLRAPGLALPGVRRIGTWRRPGERSYVCVRRGQPALRVGLRGERYDAVLVGADDAARIAAHLDAAVVAGTPRWTEVEVTVPGPVPLAGTLTLPAGSDAPVPAVALACGSGPLDRDSNHRRARFDVTRQLAHALAAAGLASLRYDKRGVGRTPGDWRAAGLHDNADDLAAALDALAARPEVDAGRLVLAGHSEGAVLAASVAARGGRAPAGVVLLSLAARPGDDLLRWQARRIAPTLPAPARALMRLFRVDLERKVATNHAKVRATRTDVARIGGARVNARWLREFLDHDPTRDLRRTAVPVLAVTGDTDLQVPADDLEVLAAAVPGGAEVHRVPGLTHTLRRQPGRASLGAYRGELRRPVDPEVLDVVVGFCRRVTAP